VILAVLVDRDPVMRHVAEAVTALRSEVVATHVPDLRGLASTLAAVTPDIVVTDLSVTLRGPHDALGAVRSLWPGPLATLSGDASVAADSACIRAAASRWLKPMAPRELADAIRARLDLEPQVTP
jgi:DNA-binding NarL/FixJ family response regulator